MLERISDLAFILRVSISVWGAEETDKETSNEILDSKSADREAGKFIKSILGGKCDELKAIKNFATAFRARLRSITHHYGTSTYLIPVAKTQEILGIMNKAETDFRELVDDFIRAYPDIKEAAKQRGGDLLKKDDFGNVLDENFPSTNYVRSRFKFTFAIEPMSDAANFDNTFDITPIKEELKEQYERYVEDSIKNAEDVLKGRLFTKVNHLYQSMHEFAGKRNQLGQKLFNGILNEIEVIKSLNIRGDASIANWCDRLYNIVEKGGLFYRENILDRNLAITTLGDIKREINGGSAEPEVVETESELDDVFAGLL